MSKLTFEESAIRGIAEGSLQDAESLIESALRHERPGAALLDSQGAPAGAADVFDGLAGVNGFAEQWHYLQYFEIVAGPGDFFESYTRPGDILLERVMGQSSLAFAEVITGGDAPVTSDEREPAPDETRTEGGCRCGCKEARQLQLHVTDEQEDSELGLLHSDEEDDASEAAPEPKAVPESDPVPFAPNPPGGSFWPFVTSNPRGREVNYRRSDELNVGSRPKRQFLAGRDGGGRYHVGVDLFANFDDPVIAIDDGRIVNFFGFCCKENKTTYALLVEHSNVVVNYGEVSPDSLSRNGLKIGSSVTAGQVIGFLGRNPAGSSMIHFETYEPGIKRNLHWYPNKQQPEGLLNPTRYLLWLQEHGRTASGNGRQPSAPSQPGTVLSSVWSRLGSAASAVRDALSSGLSWVGVRLAIAGGVRDETELTNLVFFERHKEREGRKLSKTEPNYKSLSHEWLDIRDQIVRPALSGAADVVESESFLLEEEAASAANAFVRWVQQSLNRILGLNLATDGVAGSKTRQAIKQFQAKQGLKPDGIVGTRTQQAIRDALKKLESGGARTLNAAAPAGGSTTTLPQCRGIRTPQVLDRFAFAKDDVPPQHRATIDKIAQCIVATRGKSSSIIDVEVIGHTDPVGSEPDNFLLGLRRAQAVKRDLQVAIDRTSAGASKGVTINPLSEGEKRPVAGDPALSRRVEILMTLPVVTAVRERRNVTALNAAERTALAAAINELRRRGIYQTFVHDHANSMNDAHRQSAFLPWHRQFILNYETELRAIHPSITLPYWDWSNDPGVDSSGNPRWNSAMVALMGGNGTGTDSAVTSGPFAGWTAFDSTGTATTLPLQRTFGTTSWATSLPTAAEVTTAMAVTPYDESPWDDGSATAGFRNNLEGWFGTNHLHNVVHGWVGGSMLPATSPNDPCFFLHHCFIDKIWADWQAANPGMDYLPATTQARPGRSPAHGRNADVPVFNVTTASPVTFKPSESLDMNNLKDHKGTTGIQVRYL